MPLKQSEAVVLRSYPLREADLLVTFFTRAEGKIRGVAKAAKKSRRRFGGALEPLTCVRLHYDSREGRELSRIDSCEVLQSPLTAAVDYGRAVALAHIGEMLDELMPDHESNDAVFRLTTAVLGHLQAGQTWMPVTYFDLWMVRLMGYLPDLTSCTTCGIELNGDRSFFHILADGLMCAEDKRLASSELSPQSRALATEMFRSPVDALLGEAWPKTKAADLRKFLTQIIERHIDKKLVTSSMMEKVA